MLKGGIDIANKKLVDILWEYKDGKMERRKMKKDNKEVIYDARYFDNRLPKADRCVKIGHQTLGQAQMYAIKKSEDFGYCEVAEVLQYNVGEVPQEDIVRKWGYMNGHEVDINVDFAAEKEKFIAAAHRKLAKLETTEKEKIMSASDMTSAEVAAATKGKPVTKFSSAAAKGAGKGAGKLATKAAAAAAKPKKVAPSGKGAKPKAKKEPAETVGKPGSLLHSFGLRAGTSRAGMIELMAGNMGKLLPVKEVLKATYGKPDLEKIGALKMVIKGAEEMIRMNKLDCHIARGEDAKGDLTLGLKKGKAA